jgi:hypothetical protein
LALKEEEAGGIVYVCGAILKLSNVPRLFRRTAVKLEISNGFLIKVK